jgi:hypothetical protein
MVSAVNRNINGSNENRLYSRHTHAHQHFRYQTIRQLVERSPARPAPTLVTDDPAIRPLTQYTLEDFLR